MKKIVKNHSIAAGRTGCHGVSRGTAGTAGTAGYCRVSRGTAGCCVAHKIAGWPVPAPPSLTQAIMRHRPNTGRRSGSGKRQTATAAHHEEAEPNPTKQQAAAAAQRRG